MASVITVVTKIGMYDLPFLKEFSEWYINHVGVDSIIFLHGRMPLVINISSYIESMEGRVHLFEMKSDLDINLYGHNVKLSDDIYKMLKTTNSDWMIYVKPNQLLYSTNLRQLLSRKSNIIYSVPTRSVKFSNPLYKSIKRHLPVSIEQSKIEPIIINLNFKGSPSIDTIPLNSKSVIYEVLRHSLTIELLKEIEKERAENKYPPTIERIFTDDAVPVPCNLLHNIKKESLLYESLSLGYNVLTDSTEAEERFLIEVLEGFTGRTVKKSTSILQNIEYQYANTAEEHLMPNLNSAIVIFNNLTAEKDENAHRYSSRDIKSSLISLLKDHALKKREPKDIRSFLRLGENQKIIMKIDNERFIQVDAEDDNDMRILKEIIMTRRTSEADIPPIPEEIKTFYTEAVCSSIINAEMPECDQIPGVRDIVIINLDECKQRQAYMSMILKDLNLKHSFYIVNRPSEQIYTSYIEWFNALNKFSIKQDVLKNMKISTVPIDPLFQMILPYKLSKSEFGVNSSHTYILNKIRQDDSLGEDEGYIICEDDIVISRDFRERATKLIKSRPKGIEILVLGYIDYDFVKRDRQSEYYIPAAADKLIYGCQCYFITKRGAEIFYKLSSDYSTVVDWHWLYLGAHLNILAMATIPLALNNYSDSNIQTSYGLGRFSSYLTQCRNIAEYNYIPLGLLSQPFFIKWYNNIATQHHMSDYSSFIRYLESKENQPTKQEESVWFDIFESSFKNLGWNHPLDKLKLLMSASNPDSHTGRRVDFVIVGANRSGASSLSKMLTFSKDIYIPYTYSNGRTRYFEDSDLYSKGLDYYHSHFITDRKLCGEVIPIAHCNPEILMKLKEYNPSIKLIILLREPINRVYSHWNSIKDGLKFEEFLDNELKNSLPSSALRQGCYAEQIEYMYRLFGKERVKVIISEYMNNAPSRHIRDICRYFGINDFYTRYTKENATKYTTGMMKQTFKTLHAFYKPYNEALYRLLGVEVEVWEKFYEINLA